MNYESKLFTKSSTDLLQRIIDYRNRSKNRIPSISSVARVDAFNQVIEQIDECLGGYIPDDICRECGEIMDAGTPQGECGYCKEKEGA